MAIVICPVLNGTRITDANGQPASGALIYTYLASTTQYTPVFTTLQGNVTHTNPIVCDSSGNLPAQLYITQGTAYKFVITTATGTPINTLDNIQGTPAPLPNNQWIADTATPAYVNATTFSIAGNLTSTYVPGRRLMFTTTAGTVYGTVNTATYGTSTAVTMFMDNTTVLDTGLSAVSYGLITNSVPTNNLVPAGTVSYTARTTAPSGYLIADGSQVSRTQYSVLFAAIGTAWGVGDGSTTFTLPNLIGTFIRGLNTGTTGLDANRAFGSSQAFLTGTHTHTTVESPHIHGIVDVVHNHFINNPAHIHGLGDPTHAHGYGDPQHIHGIGDPSHGHPVGDPTHSHASIGSGYVVAGGNSSVNNSYNGPNNAQIYNGTASAYTGVSVGNATTGVYMGYSPTNISIYGNATGIYMGAAATTCTANPSGTGLTQTALASTNLTIVATGGVETRPVNTALLPIIKF